MTFFRIQYGLTTKFRRIKHRNIGGIAIAIQARSVAVLYDAYFLGTFYTQNRINMNTELLKAKILGLLIKGELTAPGVKNIKT